MKGERGRGDEGGRKIVAVPSVVECRLSWKGSEDMEECVVDIGSLGTSRMHVFWGSEYINTV